MDYIINFSRQEDKKFLFDVLKLQDGERIVKIVKLKKRRSVQQNKYYWGCVVRYIQEELGYISALEVHELLKDKFIPWVKFEDEFKLSTADMTVEEIWEYIELISAWASKFLNLNIPQPEHWAA